MTDEASVEVVWRGPFTNDEVHGLHAEAFETRLYDESEWNWENLTARHSLGWVTASAASALVGFLNVPWDGFGHAWIQDVMVAPAARRRGIGTRLVRTARDEAKAAGCEWLHVDFDDDLKDFYFEACGFEPTNAGLIRLD